MTRTIAGSMGMRRIGWARVVDGRGRLRAEVCGLGHRMPRTFPVPMETASSLVAHGVPLLVHREPKPAPASTGAV